MPEVQGLTKKYGDVPQQRLQISATPLGTMSSGEIGYLGIPVDIYAHFGIELSKASEAQREKMALINSGIDGETLGDRMLKLRDIERKLGMSGMDSRLDKVYRYIRISSEIKDLEKRRKSMEVHGGNW